MTSKCNCADWFSRTCRDNTEGRCECGDECCNTGRHEDDGDGYADFMAEESRCTCPKT